MPVYLFRCGDCGKKFQITMGIKEHGTRRVVCPKCSSAKVTQQVAPFSAITKRKS